MEVLGELVGRDRRSDHTALRVVEGERSISYHDFCTTAYKAGNVLRYLGVRAGRVVAVIAEPDVHPVWAFVGTAQLGAVTRFVPIGSLGSSAAEGARVLLLPVERESAVDLEAGTKLATYGGAPTSPATLHWETELWSENPAVHPTDVERTDPALEHDGRRYSHGTLLDAAVALTERADVDGDTAVVLRAPLDEPGAVVGLLAALVAGGTAVLSPETAAAGEVAVVVDDADAPESRVVDAATLL